MYRCLPSNKKIFVYHFCEISSATYLNRWLFTWNSSLVSQKWFAFAHWPIPVYMSPYTRTVIENSHFRLSLFQNLMRGLPIFFSLLLISLNYKNHSWQVISFHVGNWDLRKRSDGVGHVEQQPVLHHEPVDLSRPVDDRNDAGRVQ